MWRAIVAAVWLAGAGGALAEEADPQLDAALLQCPGAAPFVEADRLREKARQMSLFAEIDQEVQKRLADLDAELALRRSHYEQVQERLALEARRTLEQVLPLRYALRGEARAYPIAVEIRLPERAR